MVSFSSRNAPLRGSFPAIFFVWLVETYQKLPRTKRVCLGYQKICIKHFCDAYKNHYHSRKSDLVWRHFFWIFWGGLKNLPIDRKKFRIFVRYMCVGVKSIKQSSRTLTAILSEKSIPKVIKFKVMHILEILQFFYQLLVMEEIFTYLTPYVIYISLPHRWDQGNSTNLPSPVKELKLPSCFFFGVQRREKFLL